MRQQQRGSEPEPTRTTKNLSEDEQRRYRQKTWADEAAQARTADDPRAAAPRDRAGAPSTGDEML